MAIDPEIHRLTADEYHQLVGSGGFQGGRAVEHTSPRDDGYASVEIVTELSAPHIGLAPIAVAGILAAAG